MPTANQAVSAQGIGDAIREMDLRTVGSVTGGVVTGMFLAQEVSDQVLPMLGMSAQPDSSSSAMNLLSAVGVKLLGTVVFVSLAGRFGGRRGSMFKEFTGGAAAGMLGSAGLDLFDLAQGPGLPGNAPFSSGSSSSGSSSSGSVQRVSGGSSSGSSSSGSVQRANRQPSRASAADYR